MRLLIILFITLLTDRAFAQTKLTERTITYYDSSRDRKLVTEIWYPEGAADTRRPLVMFSHGTGGDRLACRWFCEGLAAHGYTVAAVDHYGNTYTNPIPKEFITVWQRPQDISYVLTQLLREPGLAGHIDQHNIYAAGFSLGGYTVLALAGARLSWDAIIRYIHTPQGFKEINIPEMPGLIHLIEADSIAEAFRHSPSLYDARIRAVFAMAPAIGQGFSSGSQLQDVTIPVFIVGAAADSIAPVKTNAAHYKELLPQAKWYLVPGNTGHYVFLNSGNEALKNAAPIFFKDGKDVDRDAIHLQIIEKAAEYFSSHH